MKRLLKLSIILLVFALLLFTWKIVLASPKTTKTFDVPYNGKILELPIDMKKYDCVKLNRLNGKILTVCTLKNPELNPNNLPKVGGQYFYASSTILLNYKPDEDTKLHELGHHLLAVYRETKDEEYSVQEFQSLYLQINK